MTNLTDKLQVLSATLDKFKKSLQCVICLELLKNPVQTRCRHSFCQQCVTTLLQKSRHPQCPLCNTSLNRRGISEDPKKTSLVDVCCRLDIAVQLDLGVDVESYGGISHGSHEAFINSPRHKKFGLSEKVKQDDGQNNLRIKIGNIGCNELPFEPHETMEDGCTKDAVSGLKENGLSYNLLETPDMLIEDLCDQRNRRKSFKSATRDYSRKNFGIEKDGKFLVPAPVHGDAGLPKKSRLSIARAVEGDSGSSGAATVGQKSDRFRKSYRGPKLAETEMTPSPLADIDRLSSSAKVENWLQKDVCDQLEESKAHSPPSPARSRTSSYSSEDDVPLLSVSQRLDAADMRPLPPKFCSPADPYEFHSSQDTRRRPHRKPVGRPIGDDTLLDLLPKPAAGPSSQGLSDIFDVTINNTFDRLLLGPKRGQKKEKPVLDKINEKDCPLFVSPPSNDIRSEELQCLVPNVVTAIETSTGPRISPNIPQGESQDFRPEVSSTQQCAQARASDDAVASPQMSGWCQPSQQSREPLKSLQLLPAANSTDFRLNCSSKRALNKKESPSSDIYDRMTVLLPRLPPAALMLTPNRRNEHTAARVTGTPPSSEPFTHFESPSQDNLKLEQLIDKLDTVSDDDNTVVLDSQASGSVKAVTEDVSVPPPAAVEVAPPSQALDLSPNSTAGVSQPAKDLSAAAELAPSSTPRLQLAEPSTPEPQNKENCLPEPRVAQKLSETHCKRDRPNEDSGGLKIENATNCSDTPSFSLAMDLWLDLKDNETKVQKKPIVTFTLDSAKDSRWSKPVRLNGHVGVTSKDSDGRHRIDIALVLDFDERESKSSSDETESQEIAADEPARLKSWQKVLSQPEKKTTRICSQKKPHLSQAAFELESICSEPRTECEKGHNDSESKTGGDLPDDKIDEQLQKPVQSFHQATANQDTEMCEKVDAQVKATSAQILYKTSQSKSPGTPRSFTSSDRRTDANSQKSRTEAPATPVTVADDLTTSPAVRDTVTSPTMSLGDGVYLPPSTRVEAEIGDSANGPVGSGTQMEIAAVEKYALSATLFSSDEDNGPGSSQTRRRKRGAVTPLPSASKRPKLATGDADSEPVDSEELMCRVMDAVDRELGLPPKRETPRPALEVTPGTQLCSQERLDMQNKFDAERCGPPSYQQTPLPPPLSVAVAESDDDDDVVEPTPRDASAHSISTSKHTAEQKQVSNITRREDRNTLNKITKQPALKLPTNSDGRFPQASCENYSMESKKQTARCNIDKNSGTPQKKHTSEHCTNTPPRRGRSPEMGTPHKGAPGTLQSRPAEPSSVSLDDDRPAVTSVSLPPAQLFVACTGFPRPLTAKIKQMVTSIGMKFCDRVGPETTHVLVRPSPSGLPEKTLKYLQAVAAGKWVIGPGWLDQTFKNRAPVPEESYELRDCLGGCGPRKSRLASTPLFHDFVFCCIGPFSTTAIEDLRELLSLSGAMVVETPQQLKTRPQSRHVILAEEDSERESYFADLYRQCGIAPVSLDWALECISCHSLISVMGLLLAPVTCEELAAPPTRLPPECLLSDEEDDEEDDSTTVPSRHC